MIEKSSFFIPTKDNNFPYWNTASCLIDSIANSISLECFIKRNNEDWKQKELYFYKHYIYTYSKEDQFKWLSIENTFFKIIISKEVHIVQFEIGDSTLQLSGDLEFYHKTFKLYTIQDDFKQKYQLVKKIGQGAFADVFLVKERNKENQFAVKMFEKQLLQNKNDKLAFLKELQVLRALNHESVIKLYECYESKAYVYLIMEQLKGGDLDRYLDKFAPLSEKDTAKLIYSLLLALKHINSCGIIHRDLKPENIMFKEKNNVESLCITDFGLADFYNSEGKYLFTRCGSLGFVAPEILHDQNYDFKVDLYSIGIIMYYALIKAYPFDGTSLQKMQRNYVGEVDLTNIKLSDLGLQFMKDILKPNPIQRLDLQQSLTNPWFVDQKLSNFQLIIPNKKLPTSNFNSAQTSPHTLNSSRSSPRSPNSVKSNKVKSPILQGIGKHKLSNFNIEDNSSSPRGLQQAIKNSQSNNRQNIRKSIFNHLVPLKKKQNS